MREFHTLTTLIGIAPGPEYKRTVQTEKFLGGGGVSTHLEAGGGGGGLGRLGRGMGLDWTELAMEYLWGRTEQSNFLVICLVSLPLRFHGGKLQMPRAATTFRVTTKAVRNITYT